MLGHIAEALLRSGWRVTRLDPRGVACTPDNLVRALGALGGEPADLGLIVVAGNIVDGALVTDARWSELASTSVSDSMLPLSMLRAATAVPRLVVVVAGWGEPAGWLDAIATGRPTDSFVVAANARALPALACLHDALAGAAVDTPTGTITTRSLCAYLATAAPGIAVVTADEDGAVGVHAPLSGLWDPRLSRSHPVAEPTPSDLTGAMLPGQFRLDALIARGGFGAVYRARQVAVGRDVAVKVLHGDVDPSSPSGRLFVQEIHSVGRIDHPNVVRILHADVTAEGRLFFAMELLDGRDLEQIGVVPARRATDIALQLLDGLAAAHAVDLVHADIKPANVLIAGERVVLVDFGLARLRSEPSQSVGGTPAYMAPEQLRSGRVDARSDVFSAALVIVHMLTGWRRTSKDELVPPLDGIADARLRDTLARALAIDPAARFQTAWEFAAALADAPRAAPVVEVGVERPYGRERVLDELLDAVLVRRAVVLAGPAGIGKTTLVRGGLVPRLAALGIRTIYARCARGTVDEVAAALGPSTAVVLDDLDAAPATLDAVIALGATVIACARIAPDHVATIQLGPLDDAAAHDAVAMWFEERRIAIAPALVDRVARDAGGVPAQLRRACGQLYDALGPEDARVEEAHFARRRPTWRFAVPVAIAASFGAWFALHDHGGARPLHIVAIDGIDQLIAVGEWQQFGVQVVDDDGVPVAGIPVAWRTPKLGTLTYVVASDAHGMAHATQLYSSETEGDFIEVAGFPPPLLSGPWYKDAIPMMAPVEIHYRQVRPHPRPQSEEERRVFASINPFITVAGVSVTSHQISNQEIARLTKMSSGTLPDAPASRFTQELAAELCGSLGARLMTSDEWDRLAAGKPALDIGDAPDTLAEWTSTMDRGFALARGRVNQRLDPTTTSPDIGFRCVRSAAP